MRCYPGLPWRETTKNLSVGNWILRQDLNPGYPEHDINVNLLTDSVVLSHWKHPVTCGTTLHLLPEKYSGYDNEDC